VETAGSKGGSETSGHTEKGRTSNEASRDTPKPASQKEKASRGKERERSLEKQALILPRQVAAGPMTDQNSGEKTEKGWKKDSIVVGDEKKKEPRSPMLSRGISKSGGGEKEPKSDGRPQLVTTASRGLWGSVVSLREKNEG